jgi:hypothetical protein
MVDGGSAYVQLGGHCSPDRWTVPAHQPHPQLDEQAYKNPRQGSAVGAGGVEPPSSSVFRDTWPVESPAGLADDGLSAGTMADRR